MIDASTLRQGAAIVALALVAGTVSNATAGRERRVRWLAVESPVVSIPGDGVPTPAASASPVAASGTAAGFEIDVARAIAEHKAGALFLDARRSEDYLEGHVPGARTFAVWEADVDDKVVSLMSEVPLDRTVVCYCNGGKCEDSHTLRGKLLSAGYSNVLVFKDGYPAWRDQGQPVEKWMARLRDNRLLATGARLFLGAVFVYAAYHKIEYPPGFVKEIVPYHLLPAAAVNLFAIYLPWLEMLAGVALILGVWRRTAALLTTGMLLMFLFAIGSRFARGEFDFECGCFPATHSPIDAIPVLGHAKKFFFSSPNALVTFGRDLFLLVLSLFTVAASPRAASVAGPGGPGSAVPVDDAARPAGVAAGASGSR